MLEQIETLASGTVVGRLRLERVVGEGGMGVVWAARELGTERAFAVKFLRDVRRNDPASHARFMREARAAMAVRHPNVGVVHAIEVTPAGTPYLVMDLFEGETLRRRLRRSSPLSLAETARILGPVVSAVQAAHASGVVHRDLKPENIFLSPQHGVLVVDFGVAKTLPTNGVDPTSITSTGAMIGTPVYMAPEQIFGEPDIDGRVDVWALGVILYECLSGIRPTEGAGVGQVLKIITSESIPPLEQRLLQPVPPELCRLIMAMLSRRREDRPPLQILANMLAPLASLPVPSQRPPNSGQATLDTHAPIQTTMQGVGSTRAPTIPPKKSGMAWLLVLVLVLVPVLGVVGVLGYFGVQKYLEASPAPATTSARAIVQPSAPVPTAVIASAAPSTTTVTTPSHVASGVVHATPPPAVHASTSASAKVDAGPPAFRFLVYQAKQLGLGSAAAKIIKALDDQADAIKPCLPAPAFDNLWAVDVIFAWPKTGGHQIQVRAIRNNETQTSATATQICDCARAKIEAAKVPDADGQADMPNGTSAYGVTYAWARPL